LPLFLRTLFDTLVRQGISQEDLRSAFGDEMELIGQWQPGARWPLVLASVPVKDPSRARKILDALASVGLGGAPWNRTEKDGVSFYNAPGLGGVLPLALTVGISKTKLVAGSDEAAVAEAVTATTAPANALEKSDKFREAAAGVPAADSAFNYLDTRLLFERLDATVRPLLVMSAAIYPALGKKLNASDLPPPDAIAKHLSPIVMSQRYTDGGFLSESVGPITFNQAAIGAAAAIGGLYIYLHHGISPAALLPSSGPVPPPVSPTPTPTPSTSPP
jgi:hypothetical protein